MKISLRWKSKLTCRNLIQSSAYLIVCEKECSKEKIKNRFSEPNDVIDKLLPVLEGLGIIRKTINTDEYDVLINDIQVLERKLDLLFDLHKKKFG